MLIINETDVKRILEERKYQVKAKLKKLPNDSKLWDAHERKEQNINDYVMEINGVLSMFGYSELEIYLATDRRTLEIEKAKAFEPELTDGDWVEIWVMSVYNDDADTGIDYYVIYCHPLSEL